jgi:hypothetical protein
MNPNDWLEKAERLRSTLALVREVNRPDIPYAHDTPEGRERVTIAHWLRHEFSEDPPEDTQTLSLFGGGPT